MTIEATHFWIEMRNETSYGTHHIVGSQSENIVCARSDIQSKKKSSIDLSAPRTQDTPKAARMTRQIKWERAGEWKRNASEIRARERERRIHKTELLLRTFARQRQLRRRRHRSVQLCIAVFSSSSFRFFIVAVVAIYLLSYQCQRTVIPPIYRCINPLCLLRLLRMYAETAVADLFFSSSLAFNEKKNTEQRPFVSETLATQLKT